MRHLLAMLLLVLISVPALAQEPVMEHRFGPGPHFLSDQGTIRAHKVRAPRHVSRKPHAGKLAKPVVESKSQIAQAHSPLVDKARSYIGTNPTGWASLWCGRFMAMIAPVAAKLLHNPNMAREWAGLPHTTPHIGAVAVLSRGRRGGHVGVVSGFTKNGDPIIISGNHGRRVGEGVYSSRRVLAYVVAS